MRELPWEKRTPAFSIQPATGDPVRGQPPGEYIPQPHSPLLSVVSPLCGTSWKIEGMGEPIDLVQPGQSSGKRAGEMGESGSGRASER